MERVVFGWLRKEDAVAGFWRWFEKNADRIRRGVDRQDHKIIVRELGAQIAKARPGVVHEIGKPDAHTVELILSADGIRSTIPGVLDLMAAAPRLSGFKFTAFRPRQPEFSLRVGDRDIAAGHIRYLSQSDEGLLHLRLYMPSDLPEGDHGLVGFLMLDQALGEYDVMTGVGEVEFVGEEAPPAAQPLSALTAQFDAFKRTTKH